MDYLLRACFIYNVSLLKTLSIVSLFLNHAIDNVEICAIEIPYSQNFKIFSTLTTLVLKKSSYFP